MTITVQDHLQSYRAEHGEEAWRAEVQRLALAALRTSENAAAFWKTLTKDYEWLDWGVLEAEAQATKLPPTTERLIAETLKKQMPGIRSQAQYDAVVLALEAMQLAVNAVLERNADREQEARKALDQAFEHVRTITDTTMKLEEVPEAATSKAAQQFKESPAQFHEVELQAKLLSDLRLFKTQTELRIWYETTAPERERIKSQALRNELLDAVRAKRKALT